MTKLLITLLSTFLLSNIAWAHTTAYLTGINSLPGAVLEIAAMNHHPQTNLKAATPYSNEHEKYNSLTRAVLAQHEANLSASIKDASSTVLYSHFTDTNERYNSLSRGALAKHRDSLAR